MRYGAFDDPRREYVIHDPRTPVKWINYIGGLEFGGFVDQTGGALLCKGDPALNRITRYIPQMPAADFRGTTLYLRLHTPQGLELLSPFFTPCLTPFDAYECRVGLGYTRIRSVMRGLETDVLIFVPPGEACEVRQVRLRNLSAAPLRVDAVPLVEYTHFDALKQLTNADWVPQTMQSDAVALPDGRTALLQYAFMRRDTALNYFSASLPASSYETVRSAFLGHNEYGTWQRPLGLLQPELNNTQARRGDNIAALLLPLGTLQPGAERVWSTCLGQAESRSAALQACARVWDAAQVQESFDALGAWWRERLERQQVHTPDAALNSMLNIHNPRQCLTTLQWSRYLSLYQLGFGARGIGFRDSAQDVIGALPLDPQAGAALLRKLLQVQRGDGSAMHQFNPLSMVASEGDSRERDDRPHYYSDDHLWGVLAVCALLKESGDFGLLDESLPFYEKDRAGQPLESAPLLEHLCRALDFTRRDLGAHGLPRLGFADWNDTINLAPGAESLLSACLYGWALQEMVELGELLGLERDLIKGWRSDYATMHRQVNEQAWDGAWYTAYFDADGAPLGSAHNDHGQIYAYAQALPVIAGFAPAGRAQSALQAVFERLNTSFGIKLSTPGFNGFDPARGGITTYPPGAKENCGIFLHVNPWVMIAETLLGNAERAFQYYAETNPAEKNERIEVYECEPYVYPQNILGDEHPQFGLARNSWLSGTAAWMYRAAAQHLLGIRPAYDGLRVAPCIPAHWEGYRVSRLFRGVRYEIQVSNPRRRSAGDVALRVDGKPVPGGLIPLQSPGKTCRVEAEIL